MTPDLARESAVQTAAYFGTFERPGHYFWPAGTWRSQLDPIGPLGYIDGKLVPSGGEDGEALLHHESGWTYVAFYNRAWDSRPSCNSAFIFDATLTFEEAMDAARRFFPHVLDRLPFEVVERG